MYEKAQVGGGEANVDAKKCIGWSLSICDGMGDTKRSMDKTEGSKCWEDIGIFDTWGVQIKSNSYNFNTYS